MISESTCCPHCGAEIVPGQPTCEACGKALNSPVNSPNSTEGIGAILGGIFAVAPQFLAILLACPGLCDSPGVVSSFGIMCGINFILGVVVGLAVSRLSHYTVIGLVGAAVGGFLIGILSLIASFMLIP